MREQKARRVQNIIVASCAFVVSLSHSGIQDAIVRKKETMEVVDFTKRCHYKIGVPLRRGKISIYFLVSSYTWMKKALHAPLSYSASFIGVPILLQPRVHFPSSPL